MQNRRPLPLHPNDLRCHHRRGCRTGCTGSSHWPRTRRRPVRPRNHFTRTSSHLDPSQSSLFCFYEPQATRSKRLGGRALTTTLLIAKWRLDRCPLLGVKRTLVGGAAMSAFDPKRTLGSQKCYAKVVAQSVVLAEGTCSDASSSRLLAVRSSHGRSCCRAKR